MRRSCLLLAIGLALLAPAAVAHAQTDADLVAGLKAYRFGGDAAALDAIDRRVGEVRARPAERKAMAAALASVLASEASFDAKQFACRQLVFIAGEEQVPALMPLLGDESLAPHALRVLARIPGERVGGALRSALPGLPAAVRVGAIRVLGDRRDMASVPLLVGTLSKGSDQPTRTAAALALGSIGGARAQAALLDAWRARSARPVPMLAEALLACAGRQAAAGERTSALALYRQLDREGAPVERAGALRGQVQLGGASALPLVLQALKEDGTPRQMMAADLAREIPGKDATLKLSAAMPGLSARGKLLLVAALADRGDPAAAPAVIAAARGADPDLRVAALRALGAVGGAPVVDLLLRTASTGTGDAQEAAQTSLARLRGAGVDGLLAEALASGDAGVCAEAVRALGDRRAVSALPGILKAAGSRDPQVCSSAARVLRDLGQPSQIPALLALFVAASPDNRPALGEALSDIARRAPTEEQRTGAVLQALAAQKQAATRADLVSLLGQIGGPRALVALRAAAKDDASEVRMASLQQLAEWPTDEPLKDLLAASRAATETPERVVALRAYVRMVGARDDRSPAEAMALYNEAAPMAANPAEKRLILSGIARVGSVDALKCAAGFLSDAELKPEAELAAVSIGRAIVGAWPAETRAALEPIARGSANEDTRKAAQAVLDVPAQLGEFVGAWEVSPAYQQAGKDYAGLFGVPFPPEETGKEATVPWRPMPVLTDPKQPWLLDLLALWGGEQKVAYLRTNVWSETARPLVLELGSDDGIKVWWDGAIVLAHNVARAVAPAQEKVTVQAKAGWNPLMLKVTQNIMGWGACARFTNPDGSAAAGLRYSTAPGGSVLPR